jgi:hypothetical protein
VRSVSLARAVLAVALTMTTESCPEGGNNPPAGQESKKPGLGPIGNHSLECDIYATMPLGTAGPDTDKRPGFYAFTAEAQADVSCTGKVAQIKITVVYQHNTNGYQGAVTGRDSFCQNERSCPGAATYRRDRLNCNIVYNYDDYTHATAWYKRDPNSPEVRISKEGRHKKGTSYSPFFPCRTNK